MARPAVAPSDGTRLSERDLSDLARLTASPMGFAQLGSRGRYATPPHLRLINEKLLDIAERRIRRLMVFAPPRHGKSALISHFFSAWYLATHPEHRILLSCYGADFAATWGRKARDVLTAYGPLLYGVGINERSSAADAWDIADHTGGMNTAGVGGSTTGRGADCFLIDDPVKNAEEALSPAYRDKIWDWYQSVARTRLEPNGAIVLTMARWHEEDLAGRILAQAAQGGERWEVISLPALAESGDMLGRPLGTPLWPDRFGLGELGAIRDTLESAFWWYALYQQRPTPATGSVFQRAWFTRRYRDLPRLTYTVQAVDSAFKEGVGSDYSVIATWGTDGRDFYLLHVWRARVAFPELCYAIRDQAAIYHPDALLIEDRASGQSAIQVLKRETSLPIIGVAAEGSKVSRAEGVSPLFEAGKCVLPEDAPWVADFIDEHVSFPRGAHDDAVDTSSYALARLRHVTGHGAIAFATTRFRSPDAMLAPEPAEPTPPAPGTPPGMRADGSYQVFYPDAEATRRPPPARDGAPGQQGQPPAITPETPLADILRQLQRGFTR